MNTNLLFSEIVLEANIVCRNCNEELKYTFEEAENPKTIYKCNCGKCILKVSPRKRTYVVCGDHLDHSISVIAPIVFKTTYKDWRI